MSVDGYQKVANRKELKEGRLLRVEPEGRPIVLAMISGRVYAIDAVCSHEGGPLEEGTLEGYELKCPWHYAVFDVRTAKVSDQTVWATDLHSYPVKIDEKTGDILLSLETPRDKPTPEKRDPNESQKQYYESEEKKANKLTIELLAKTALAGTDILTFKWTRQGLDFRAGQYAFFELDNVTTDPKGPIRHFSLASSPTEQDLIISTRIRDSPYKEALAGLRDGMKITAWGPQGEFVLHEDESRPAVFLSGGIGVTPFRSMVKYATDKRLPLKITMFDSNRNQENILYKHEFDEWAAENKNFKPVYTITGESGKETPADWTAERGRIDRPMLQRHLTKDEIESAIFYICGPPGMLKAMRDLLDEIKVPKSRIKIEEFTGY